MNHDIDEWSAAFLDASWNCEVIRASKVRIFLSRIYFLIFVNFFSLIGFIIKLAYLKVKYYLFHQGS